VDSQAAYCSNCGKAQPRANPEAISFLDGMSNRTASMLCYIPVFGVIPAIVFLAAHRFRGNIRVRFDAFQSLYLFLAWLIISSAIPVLIWQSGWGLEHAFLGCLKLVLFICWVYLLIKAAKTEQIRLPILGDLAARSTMEQL
jgi:uncharacterized membrane protein